MADYVTAIRTADGDKKIDYKALANKPTATDIGAVKNTGDTMKGNLHISNADPNAHSLISVIDSETNAQGALWQTNNQTVLSNRNVKNNKQNQRSLVINNSAQSEDLDYALRLYTTDGDKDNWYNILHTGNTSGLIEWNKYTWKRRKVNYSVTLGESITVSMTTYNGSSSITCSFSYSASHSIDRDSNSLTLPNATSASVSYDSSKPTTSVKLNNLKGKYWKHDGNFYFTPTDAANSVVTTEEVNVGGNEQTGPIYKTRQTMSITAQPVTFSGITYGDWETVYSPNATAYPETYTYENGYEYIKYGGLDNRQCATSIKYMTYYGTGTTADRTIYVDAIPTLFIIYEGSTPILFRWGHPGIVLESGVSSGITRIGATYNATNKSITFSKEFETNVNYMNEVNRYHCFFIYG